MEVLNDKNSACDFSQIPSHRVGRHFWKIWLDEFPYEHTVHVLTKR